MIIVYGLLVTHTFFHKVTNSHLLVISIAICSYIVMAHMPRAHGNNSTLASDGRANVVSLPNPNFSGGVVLERIGLTMGLTFKLGFTTFNS